MPEYIEYLWTWFSELSATRGNGFGISPISYTEIYSWSLLTGNRLDLWELEIIKIFDSAWLHYQAKQNKPPTNTKQKGG